MSIIVARLYTVAVIAACLLSPAPTLAQSRPFDGVFTQALEDGEQREVTSTASLRLDLECEVIAEGQQRTVIGTITIAGSQSARLRSGGFGWSSPSPSESATWRFGASSENPVFPHIPNIPDIKVQAGGEFLHLVGANVALGHLAGFPCVFGFTLRQRGLP